MRGKNNDGDNGNTDNSMVWGNHDNTPKVKASPKPVWSEFEFGLRKNCLSVGALYNGKKQVGLKILIMVSKLQI